MSSQKTTQAPVIIFVKWLIGKLDTKQKERALFRKLSIKYNLSAVTLNKPPLLPPLLGMSHNNTENNVCFRIDSKRTIFKSDVYAVYEGDSELHGQRFGIPKKYWVYTIRLDRELPYFVLDSMFNRVRIQKVFNDYQEIELEGDFSNAFKLYAPKKDQINVLAVVSPDFMDSLIPYWKEVDVIVAGKTAWLISRYSKQSKEFERLLEVGDRIYNELEHSSRTHRYGV